MERQRLTVSRRRLLAGMGGAVVGSSFGRATAATRRTNPRRRSVAPTVPSLQTREYRLRRLPFEKWPQEGDCRHTPGAATRLSGVATVEFRGDRGVHVVKSARRVLDLLACYRNRETGEDRYLGAATDAADGLLEVAFSRDGALLFPYTFVYDTANRSYGDLWFSGMGQGLALAAFVRLARLTGSARYWQAATETFRSFAQFRDAVDAIRDGLVPWVVLESDGYYWIEEYPSDPPDHTLNGMNFAIQGLYEYWRATESPVAEYLLKAALTTVAEHAFEYRVENEYSYYCLRHRVQDAKYHRIHVGQLGLLHRLSGDPTFETAATLFREDGDAADRRG